MSFVPQIKDYIIIKTIGKGSTSTVYLAHAKEDVNRMVAIKVIERSTLSKSSENAVVNEIHVTKKLKHKHIVEMIDFSLDSQNIYIIFEHCDGGDLSTFIKQHTKLSEKLCRKFMQQLGLALQFLRSHNISHLDLKPHNLFLMKSPRLTLKVGDFGFASTMSEDTQMNNIRGSPLYMAPEMLLRSCYGVKADLWSVGVIAYECIFGHAPYASDCLIDLYEKVKKVLPIEISSNQVSPECRHLILGLLKHDPSERLSYNEFFKHPFLDLDHAPSTKSLAKGIEAIAQALHFDQEKQYEKAFSKYCDALQYLIPYFQVQPDKTRRMCSIQVNEYIKRAEELKAILQTPEIKTDSQETADKSSTSSEYDDHSKKLTLLCQNTPELASAVEIALSGQMYLFGGQYKEAVEKYEIGLNILEKLLVKEPPGMRFNLLTKQIDDWRNQYVNAKAFLQSKDQKVGDQPADVIDGLSTLTISTTDRKLFKAVSRVTTALFVRLKSICINTLAGPN